MTATLGYGCVLLALALAAWGIVAPVLHARTGIQRFHDSARYAIADAGYNPDYGARPLRRVIQSEVQDPLSEALLEGRFVPGDTIQVDFVPHDPAEVTKEGVVSEITSSARNPFDAANGKADDEGPRGRYEFTAIAHEEVQEPEDSETAEALEALLQ